MKRLCVILLMLAATMPTTHAMGPWLDSSAAYITSNQWDEILQGAGERSAVYMSRFAAPSDVFSGGIVARDVENWAATQLHWTNGYPRQWPLHELTEGLYNYSYSAATNVLLWSGNAVDGLYYLDFVLSRWLDEDGWRFWIAVSNSPAAAIDGAETLPVWTSSSAWAYLAANFTNRNGTAGVGIYTNGAAYFSITYNTNTQWLTLGALVWGITNRIGGTNYYGYVYHDGTAIPGHDLMIPEFTSVEVIAPTNLTASASLIVAPYIWPWSTNTISAGTNTLTGLAYSNINDTAGMFITNTLATTNNLPSYRIYMRARCGRLFSALKSWNATAADYHYANAFICAEDLNERYALLSLLRYGDGVVGYSDVSVAASAGADNNKNSGAFTDPTWLTARSTASSIYTTNANPEAALPVAYSTGSETNGNFTAEIIRRYAYLVVDTTLTCTNWPASVYTLVHTSSNYPFAANGDPVYSNAWSVVASNALPAGWTVAAVTNRAGGSSNPAWVDAPASNTTAKKGYEVTAARTIWEYQFRHVTNNSPVF